MRVDTRSADVRASEIITTAEFELRTGLEVARCECGASTLRPKDDNHFACAGCGAPQLRPSAAAHIGSSDAPESDLLPSIWLGCVANFTERER